MATKITKTKKVKPTSKGQITVGPPKKVTNYVTVFGIDFEQDGKNYTFGKAIYTPAPYLGPGEVADYGHQNNNNIWNFIRYQDERGGTMNAPNGYIIFRRHTDGLVDVQWASEQYFHTNYHVLDDADLSKF